MQRGVPLLACRCALTPFGLLAALLISRPVLAQPPSVGTAVPVASAPVATAPAPAPAAPSGTLQATIQNVCSTCERNECRAECTEFNRLVAAPAGAPAPHAAPPAAPVRAAAAADCTDPTSACYPSYWGRHGVDLETIAEGSPADRQLMRLSWPTSAGLPVNVLGAFQSFLEERAKEEAMAYAVTQLQSLLCTDQYQGFLESTCELADAGDLRFDDETLRLLKRALLKDAARLPAGLIQSLPATNDKKELAMRAFGSGAANTFAEIVTTSLAPLDVPKTWAARNRTAYRTIPQAHRLTCSAQTGFDGPCFAFLLPELGAAAAGIESWPPSPEMTARVIESASVAFCGTYGPSAQAGYGACLLGDRDTYARVKVKIEKLVAASGRFVEIHQNGQRLRKAGKVPRQIAREIAPELVDAFEDWSEALQEALPSPAYAAALNRVAVALQVGQALLEEDADAVLDIILKSLEKHQSFETVKLPPKVIRSISFVLRLASAKNRDDAKKVFEEAAAPLGTYKVKYDRDGATLAVNSFVGTFGGYGTRYAVRDGRERGFELRPLAAPTGIDWTFASYENHHLGVLFSAIDPFGAGVVSETKATELDWGSILALGIHLRWGVLHSPFVFSVGAVSQPLARGPKDCVNAGGVQAPCWRGAVQALAGISVDIPLIVLH